MINKEFFLKPVPWIFLLFLVLRSFLVDFGLPYHLHSDEIYILKDPFKLIDNFSHFSFDAPMNITYYIHLIWYGILFVFGFALSIWKDLEEFKGHLALETPLIMIWGRILSLILSTLAAYVLYALIRKITKVKWIQIIGLITLMYNPFELISNIWIKYDPYVYLVFCILLFYVYSYVVLKDLSLKKKLYIWMFISLTVRIDLIIVLIAVGLYDVGKLTIKNVLFYVQSNWKLILIGTLTYSLITLLPIVFIHNLIYGQVGGHEIVKPFWEVIITKILAHGSGGTFLKEIGVKIYYYFIQYFLICLGPICFYYFFKGSFRREYLRPFFIMFCINSLFLIIMPFHTSHYFLLNSTIVIIVTIIELTESQRRYVKVIALGNAVYIVSLSFVIYFGLFTTVDSRILARNYVMGNSGINDLIGVEDHILPGKSVPIDEKPSVLLAKAAYTLGNGLGTGLSYKKKAENVSIEDSRFVLGICKNYDWSEIGLQNKWFCKYSNLEYLDTVGLDFIVTTTDYDTLQLSEYGSFLNQNFRLNKTFEHKFLDPRVEIMTHNEWFLNPTFIWRK